MMHTSKLFNAARTRAAYAKWVALASLVALIAGCYNYVALPGETRYERVSPVYALEIVNRTGVDFAIEPSDYGKDKRFASQPVADGASFPMPLQLRSFYVNEQDAMESHQVIDAPYIAQAGANTAVIRIRHAEQYLLTIDLESERWFVARDPASAVLKIELRDFSPKRWFTEGPP